MCVNCAMQLVAKGVKGASLTRELVLNNLLRYLYKIVGMF